MYANFIKNNFNLVLLVNGILGSLRSGVSLGGGGGGEGKIGIRQTGSRCDG